MTRKILSIFTAAAFLLCGAIPLSHSQTIPDQLADTSKIWFIKNPKEWPMAIRPGTRVGTKSTQWYTDIFWPFAGAKDTLVFINPKFVWSAKDSNEQNIGAGARHLMYDENIMVGGNFFYDTRRTENDNRFYQIACGIEAFSKWIDVRANYYYPISEAARTGREEDGSSTYYFASRSLNRRFNSIYEEPLMGYDCELGFLVPFVSDFIETRLYAGWYQYFSDYKTDDFHCERYGLRTRMEIRPIPAFTFDLEITSDEFEMKNTNAYVGGYFTVPFSLANLFTIKNPFEGWQEYVRWKKGPRSMRSRMTDKVIRDLDIVYAEVKNEEDEKIHDVVFVDNSNTGATDGTLEHPYTDIDNGMSAAFGDKWVYVKKGNADYTDSYVTNTANITVWGSGYNGGFNGIPSDTGPEMDPGGGDAFLVNANGVTIMGFVIDNDQGFGISAASDSNLTITHNTIRNCGSIGATNAVQLSGTYSGISITHNTITGTAGGQDGISIAGTYSNITVSNNTIIDFDRYGVNISGTDQGSVSFSQNSIYSNTTKDFYTNKATATNAENNWWGITTTPAGLIQDAGAGATDYDPWLMSDPN